MISSIVAKILNRTLNSFIDDLTSDQLNISLFSGVVNLENVSVKKTVLDNFPMLFRLEYGTIGRIYVDVPMTSIGSSPVVVEVSDVYVLLK